MKDSRRTFLKTVTASSLFLAQWQQAPLERKSNVKPLGIALVGLGSYATNQLAPAFAQTTNCYLAGIVTGTPSKAEIWKNKYNISEKNIYNYQNFDDIANNKDIDIVYVVLPNSMHHEFVIRAAKAGKHVICEKPMSVSVKEAHEMIAACKQAGVRLMIGYRLHYEPFTNEVIRLSKNQEFGKVKFIEASFGWKNRNINAWRMQHKLSGGGALMDVGIYAINACRYATGEEPISVTAQSIKTEPSVYIDIEETIMWQLKFPSGIITQSTSTYNGNIHRLFVSYENGFLEMSPAYDYGPLKGRTSKGEMNFPIVHHQTYMLDGICDEIIHNKPSKASGEEGLQDMKIIEAIYQSAQTGREIKIS
ncbi:Gfo/Idh/MocA family protein [Flectobacillus major]|jgi:predicted dehydrogenase|uniref:Gfo/Idh/MocA family protein n=1 Tax=Flectobacillus major TaxID=103 RepID=UPI0003FE50C0|nr:Gfo/Idh/MocA family oxidoreductase [Flectobacillus major]